MPRLAQPAREPRSATAAYIRDLTRIWRVVQSVIVEGLNPLLEVWGESDAEVDRLSEGVIDSGNRPNILKHYTAVAPRIECTPPDIRGGHFRTDATTPNAYNPLAPQPRRRQITSMSDAELRRLWPTIEPEALRRHAPWATSRDEVVRVAFPGQGLPAGDAQVEEYVRQAISTSQASPFATPDVPTTPAAPPGPGAFRLRPLYAPPVILGASGLPIPAPPRPVVLSAEAVTRQLDWLELATHEMVTTGNLEPVTTAAGQRTDRWVTRENLRVLGIDPRADPGQALQLRQWGQLNANLIESGIAAPWDGIRLRPLLSDVERTVRNAHAGGLRVEVLAQQIKERFAVSESRAALIARDQTLKLNGQLNRSKQQAAGISQYQWSTSRDERVRETHQVLDGTTHSWDVPPPGTGHPGDDYQCRCTARAIVPEFGDAPLTEQEIRARQEETRGFLEV